MAAALKLRTDLFGFRPATARGGVEARQPEPTASIFGGGSQWHGSGAGRADRRHGSPDALRSWVQRFNEGGPTG